jgi:ferredoxin-NADP reductase
MSDGGTLHVEVTTIEQITPLIKHFTLRSVDRTPLPAFSGGSHVVVVMRAVNRVHRNPYSLLSPPSDRSAYQIAVRRMEDSRGGSLFMHEQLSVGSRLEIAHPVNLFPLDKIARKHVLIAGGIGITPCLAQLEDLHDGAIPYELHYAVRSGQHAAFGERLRTREGDRVRFYHDNEAQAIDYDALLSAQPLGTHVYVCGPAGMISRVIETARRWGWPDSHVHWEKFSAPPVGDAFEVFLARAKIAVKVLPDQSLLEAIEAVGVEVPYLCRGGVCGFCQTRVLEADGELLHYDHYLTDVDKARGKSIMPCVSRADCKKLVLDL